MQAQAALNRVLGRPPIAEEVRLPGMLHGAVLRSPYPHALIRRLDASGARELSGVVAVATGADGPGRLYGPQLEDQPILAGDRVRYVGEPLVAVAAQDEVTARRAVELIEVEYEPLPAVYDAVEAGRADAPLVHPGQADAGGSLNFDLRPIAGTNVCHRFRLRQGDLEAALAEADVVVEGTFFVPSAQHVAMEPHVSVAGWDRESLTVHTGTQTPFDTRRILAGLFGLPPEHVRVIAPPLGGGYGAKSFPKLEPIAALLARLVGRPVRLALSREEEFVTLNRHASTIHMRIGARADGTLLAKDLTIHWNTGAYADSGPGVAQKGGYHGIGPYRVPNVAVESLCVYTNLPPNGAFRGYSATQPLFATEQLMDRLAARLGIDALELRLRNALRQGDRFVTGETMGDVHFGELLQTAADGVSWVEGRREELPDGRIRGRGVAVTLKGMQTPSRCRARLVRAPDGSVTVHVGTVEMGQGSGSAMSALAAAELGIVPDRVSVVQADTARVPFDARTTSSRSSFMMANAIALAARKLREDPAAPEAEAEFANEGGLDPDTGQGVGSSQWNQSAVAAQVAVDPSTGKVEVERIHASVYAGRVVDPVAALLQTEGNVVMGIGSALFEEIVFEDGQVVNPNLSEYLVPSLADVPGSIGVTLLEKPGAQVHGLGETALPPTPAAIANAVAAALGIEPDRLPLTPERVVILSGAKDLPAAVRGDSSPRSE